MAADRSEVPDPLIQRAQRGDREAQAVVLRRYAGPLHALAKRAGPPGDTDALAQALLEHLLRALPSYAFDGPAKFTTWVFTVAHHFLIDEHRREPKLKLVPLEEAKDIIDPHADASIGAHSSQLRSALERAIAQLPEDQRRVFVLVHLHEQPLEAVARAENLPLGTVKSRLFRARARLAQALGDEHGH